MLQNSRIFLLSYIKINNIFVFVWQWDKVNHSVVFCLQSKIKFIVQYKNPKVI